MKKEFVIIELKRNLKIVNDYFIYYFQVSIYFSNAQFTFYFYIVSNFSSLLTISPEFSSK